VSKFVAKFRKNDYDEDYEFMPKRKRKGELGEMRKMKKRRFEDYDGDTNPRSSTNKYRKSY
jgi:hypothetical protein